LRRNRVIAPCPAFLSFKAEESSELTWEYTFPETGFQPAKREKKEKVEQLSTITGNCGPTEKAELRRPRNPKET